MNTVKKCSISGIAFTLADDAFEVLDAYLKRLRTQYAGHKDGDEIVADIEARIAELILSVQDGTRTVELPLIRNIIAQMGSPEQIGEEGAEGPKPAAPRIPRRLYRDPENAKLGGVCAGLGKYFDVDSVWIRLAFFSPLLAMVLFNWIPLSHFFDRLAGNLMGFFVLGYLIMWFVVPTARTARQKLEMKGERITSAAIGSATAAAGGVDGDSKTVVASTVSAFGTVLLILLKLFAGLIVFTLMVAACGLIVALFSLCRRAASVRPLRFPRGRPNGHIRPADRTDSLPADDLRTDVPDRLAPPVGPLDVGDLPALDRYDHRADRLGCARL